MPEPTKPVASNEERGLVRHVNPADPTGPRLDYLPDVQDRLEAQLTTAETRPRKPKRRPSKKRSKKKA